MKIKLQAPFETTQNALSESGGQGVFSVTSLIAWIAVDQRSPSALYMASDSRISWGSGNVRWDAGRKLFICQRYPDLFGYSGDVVFPSLVLSQITEAADAGLLFQNENTSEDRHIKFVAAIKQSFSTRFGTRPNVEDFNFQILHASRQFSGQRARFKLWRLSLDVTTRIWMDTEIVVPDERSALLEISGSGAGSVKSHYSNWERSSQGGTSRAIFGAFCDSIQDNSDAFSGSVPQLVGMFHTRMPQAFGIIHDDCRYFYGLPLPFGISPEVIEWRDNLFQRIDDKTLKVVTGAQRHVRPKSS